QLARESDYAGRYGGEEFVVLLPDTSLAGASQFAERLRCSIEQLNIDYEGLVLTCTVSMGVACIQEGMPGYGMLIEAADRALYRSKARGRNCTTLSDTGELAL